MTDDLSTTPGENDAGLPGADKTETPKKRRTWIWILAAVLVVAVVGVAYAASQSEGSGWLLFFRGTTVPQVVGLSQQEAETSIASAGLKLGQISDSPTLAVAPGIVVTQSPTGSTKVKKDSAVDLSVSVVPGATVPDVVGKTQSDASGALAEEGLLVGATTYVYDTKVKAGYVKSQDPAAGSETHVGAAVALTVSKGQQTGQVPNVIGMSESDAKSALDGAGFKVATTKATNADVPAGDVVLQSPAAGTIVAAGSTVTITVSSGPPPAPKPSVPNVVGKTEVDATSALEDAGFKVAKTKATNAEVPVGNVSAQSPAAGSAAAAGSTVTITVSTGPATNQKPTVPDVVGLSERDARSTLEGAGFATATTKTASTSVAAGDVISQSPSGGTAAAQGSTVTITVSTGAPSAPKATVPNVDGMGVLEAIRTLRDADLKFSIAFTKTAEDFLKVAAQDPKSGVQVDPGSTVEISIGLPGFLLEGGGAPPSTPSGETPTTTPAPAEPSSSAPTTP